MYLVQGRYNSKHFFKSGPRPLRMVHCRYDLSEFVDGKKFRYDDPAYYLSQPLVWLGSSVGKQVTV